MALVVDICDLGIFPPLPEPDRRQQRQQSTGGCVTVLVNIAAHIALVHGVAFWAQEVLSVDVLLLFVTLVWAETVVACGCLLGLMLGDPGVIKRSAETSLPVPVDVEEKLRSKVATDGMNNIPGDSGRTYCVRCFVWREKDGHHCRTCGRCVREFDHHCGVFGRCIAGGLLSGNMKYFRVIIAMGSIAFGTTSTFVIWGATLIWGWWAIFAVIGLAIGAYCACLGLFGMVCGTHQYIQGYRLRQKQRAAVSSHSSSGEAVEGAIVAIPENAIVGNATKQTPSGDHLGPKV